jgi:hypothetical protein
LCQYQYGGPPPHALSLFISSFFSLSTPLTSLNSFREHLTFINDDSTESTERRALNLYPSSRGLTPVMMTITAALSRRLPSMSTRAAWGLMMTEGPRGGRGRGIRYHQSCANTTTSRGIVVCLRLFLFFSFHFTFITIRFHIMPRVNISFHHTCLLDLQRNTLTMFQLHL